MTSASSDEREPRSLWDVAFQFNPANLVAALIVAFLVGALAGVVVLTRPAKFDATAAVAVDQPSLIASGGDRVIDKLQRLRVKYAPLLRTDVIADPLSKQLGTSPGVLRASLSATAPVDSLLIVITAHTGSRTQSQNFANKAAQFLVTYAKDEQTRDNVPAAEQFQLVVVDQARPGAKVEPTQQRAIAVTLASALIGGALAYVLLQLLRPRPRRRPPDTT